MNRDFRQCAWDELADEDCRQLIRLAVREDLERQQDWTTLALAPEDAAGAADIVAREAGTVAGVEVLRAAAEEMALQLTLDVSVADGQQVEGGARLARLSGSVRDLLTSERILLNFLGRLMGVATLTQHYVAAVAGTSARIYDTRKTTPGWRRLEKYAVRCGGGRNHRLGLYDAILIKDNHLAQLGGRADKSPATAAAAVRQARQFLKELALTGYGPDDPIIEIEVDCMEQLKSVLPERPDIALLDNMPLDGLRQAVALRDSIARDVQLEASGGVRLETVRAIAETGVDRISVGALTHGARALDVGLDWPDGP